MTITPREHPTARARPQRERAHEPMESRAQRKRRGTFVSQTMARSCLRLRAILLGSVLTLSLAAPSVARADDVTITPEARSRFSAGVNLLKDPDGPRYEEAYREFRAAYAASPSYKILGNLGLCAMKLERDDEAIQAYEKYVAWGKALDASELAQVKTDLDTLKAGVAYLTVTSDPPGAKIVDVRLPVRGERVTNNYGPITTATRLGVRQGSHQITAKLDGYPDVTWEFDAGATEVAPHAFTFKKLDVAVVPVPVTTPTPVTVEAPKVAERPVPTGVYVGLAATGVFAAAAVVTGVLALGKHSDFDNANTGQNTQTFNTATSAKSDGQTLNIINDVCVGGAIVAAGVTAVLYVVRPTILSDAKAPAAASASGVSSWRLAPLVSATGGGLSVGARF
jgi:hypothetical protein